MGSRKFADRPWFMETARWHRVDNAAGAVTSMEPKRNASPLAAIQRIAGNDVVLPKPPHRLAKFLLRAFIG